MKLKKVEYKRRPYALFAFLWAFALAALIITPIIILDKGYFLYYGDFNVQEIPFYQLAHDSIRSGNVGWSHLTDLGANFVGSYSFYLLGSPFFWLTTPLPSAWLPYTIGPLLALKLGLASLTAYIYIKRYVRDPYYAVVGGILYAFSSFSLYNVFFFHFHEAMIVFPLLLAAIDEFHSTGRKGLVAIAVFACATVNYYFFFGQALFAVIYYIVKNSVKSYRFNWKNLLLLIFEGAVGVSLSAVLLLPSIAAITGNYRVSELINGWNAVIYPRTQRYVQILVSFFFPGDLPSTNNFTPSAGAKWSSVAAYLPLFSTTFVVAWLRQRKRSFYRRILLILFIMALIPALNTTFQALNSTYYARWFYMITLIMAVVTVKSLDQSDSVSFFKGYIPTAVITLAATLIIGLIPQKTEENAKEDTIRLGIAQTPRRFWAFAIIALVGIILTGAIYLIYKKKPKYVLRFTAIFLSVFVVGYGTVYLWIGKSLTDHEDSFMQDYALNRGSDITLTDVKDVRSDFYNSMDNIGLYWQIPNIQAFHSIVPGSLIDFYNSIGVERDVGSRPSTEFYGLRALFSVKYLFEETDDTNTANIADVKAPMPGFRFTKTENGYFTFINEHYVPMGFVYDRFITEEEFNDLSDDVKHLALLKAMVLSQDQIAKYADITGYTDGQYLNLNFQHNKNAPQNKTHPVYEDYESLTGDFVYGEDEYFKDADKLAKNACSAFAYDNEGFTASFKNTGGDNLLFFSVPYDEGWTAYVNGERVDIERADLGFMAVKVKGHSNNEIRFVYRTPLLREGIIVSCIAAVILAVYLIIFKGFCAKRISRTKYRIKQKSNIK